MTETNWQTGLQSQGAVIKDGIVQHFGHAANELVATSTTNTLCDLSHLGLLSLSGEDAKTFLQGQVTNDVNLLNDNAHYSAYCTPKGRMLALFLAFMHNGQLTLQLSQPLLTPVMKRLTMYVMRSKVNIQDVSNDILKFGLNGPDATSILQKAFDTLPSQDYASTTVERDGQASSIIKLPSIEGQSRYELFIAAAHAPSVWALLKTDCTPVGKSCWDWLDIQTGLPDVLAETQEQFVPQMLNLDRLNGINFKKGCYTGQEIVARTHYLGAVKRRTYLASIVTKEIPKAGDKVLNSAEREVGQLVKVAPNLHNGFDALIEMRIEAKEEGGITWGKTPITIATLPYSLEDVS